VLRQLRAIVEQVGHPHLRSPEGATNRRWVTAPDRFSSATAASRLASSARLSCSSASPALDERWRARLHVIFEIVVSLTGAADVVVGLAAQTRESRPLKMLGMN